MTLRILIVDDEASTVRGLKKLLELDGHTVTAFTSATEAIAALSSTAFDVVITDLEMLDIGGVGVVREAVPKVAAVFVLTGYAGSPAAHNAVSAGARRVLPKPLDYDELTNELALVTTS